MVHLFFWSLSLKWIISLFFELTWKLVFHWNEILMRKNQIRLFQAQILNLFVSFHKTAYKIRSGDLLTTVILKERFIETDNDDLWNSSWEYSRWNLWIVRRFHVETYRRVHQSRTWNIHNVGSLWRGGHRTYCWLWVKFAFFVFDDRISIWDRFELTWNWSYEP